jgi:hypothetical protein
MRGILEGGLSDMSQRGPEALPGGSVRQGKGAAVEGAEKRRLKCVAHFSLQVTDWLLREESAFSFSTGESGRRPQLRAFAEACLKRPHGASAALPDKDVSACRKRMQRQMLKIQANFND